MRERPLVMNKRLVIAIICVIALACGVAFLNYKLTMSNTSASESGTQDTKDDDSSVGSEFVIPSLVTHSNDDNQSVSNSYDESVVSEHPEQFSAVPMDSEVDEVLDGFSNSDTDVTPVEPIQKTADNLPFESENVQFIDVWAGSLQVSYLTGRSDGVPAVKLYVANAKSMPDTGKLRVMCGVVGTDDSMFYQSRDISMKDLVAYDNRYVVKFDMLDSDNIEEVRFAYSENNFEDIDTYVYIQ